MSTKYLQLAPNSRQYTIEFEIFFASKKENDRASIPSPGETRKWNNMCILIEYIIENEFEIRHCM